MSHLHTLNSALPKLSLSHFLIVCLLFSLAYSDDDALVFKEVRPPQRFAVSTSSPYFQVDFSHRQAFRTEVESFNGDKEKRGFCKVYPSQISAELEYNGIIDDEDSPYFDNIAYFDGYFFLLDSLNYNVLTTRDIQEINPDDTIVSDFQNEIDENGEYDEPFLVIDSDNGVLYIVTSQHLYSYPLSGFFDAMSSGDEIPSISKFTPHFEAYESISYVVHHKGMLFIVADNHVDAFVTDGFGRVSPLESLDAKFFGAKEIAIVDMTVSENYLFLVDKLEGLLVLEITDAEGKGKLKYRQDLNQIKLTNGQFVEVIGRSVNVISSTTKSHYVKEYMIKGDPKTNIQGFEFNRKIDLFESVRNTYADANFLYILTGSFNIVLKHSIPVEYDPSNEEGYLYQYWPVFGIKTMITVQEGLVSQAVTLQEDNIAVFTFSEDYPYINCNLTGVAAGIYTYVINSLQTTCAAKESVDSGAADDIHSICATEESIELIVPVDDSRIGNLTQKNQMLVLLLTGVLSAIILSCIILYLAMKYRRRTRALEDQIKFHQLSQSVEGGGKDDQDDKTDAEIEVKVKSKASPVKGKGKGKTVAVEKDDTQDEEAAA